MAVDVTKTCRDVAELAPVAQTACRLFFQECAKAGVNVFVTETYRSQARQNYLYEQGRTRPGQIVTWTRSSNHSGRLAWDIAVCSPLGLYDKAVLLRAGAIASKLGITWGGDWKANIDRPHFEVKANWKAPAGYKLADSVIVPSTSTGKVVMAVKDVDVSDKLGFNVTAGACKYRLQSGKYPTHVVAEQARKALMDGKFLSYSEVKGDAAGGYRVQSGAYTTVEAAEQVAKAVLQAGKLAYITIQGTAK